MLTKALTVKALVTVGVLALGTVSAAAATGTLPDAAQDGLANAASHVGLTLPAGHDNHPTKDSHPGGKPDATPTTSATPTSHPDNHGAEVSEVAHTTDATGRAKGEAISTVARGEHGGGKPDDVSTPSTGAPVETPNSGGIGTGSTASDGANSPGANHAADQAASGSANADDHLNRP